MKILVGLLIFKITMAIDLKHISLEVKPDYDYDWKIHPKISIRTKILNKKREENRIKTFDDLNKNAFLDKIFVDDIPHRIAGPNTDKVFLKTIKSIEDDFKGLVMMKHYNYIYKRDLFWRTWREVQYPNGSNIIVHYKSPKIITAKSNSSGFWVIEENSQCLYEIFSMINRTNFCVDEIAKLSLREDDCPVNIVVSELSSNCDNPIVTHWNFTKNYDQGSDVDPPSVIGGGKENFEVLTIYKINPEEVVYQIVNSSNAVIYSKVMRYNKTNFVCIENCGTFDPDTMKIAKQEKPYRLNLLETISHKAKKRENKLTLSPGKVKEIEQNKVKGKKSTITNTKMVNAEKNKRKREKVTNIFSKMKVANRILEQKRNQYNSSNLLNFNYKDITTMSNCRKLIQEKEKEETEYDDDRHQYSF